MRPTTVRRPTRAQVSTVLLALKAAVLSSVLALGVTTGLAAYDVPAGGGAGPRTTTLAMDSSVQQVHRKMAEHQCSATGFAPGVHPGEALVRTGRGHLRVVDFDRGWEIFTGHRPGLLVAVCLGRDRS